MCGIAGCDWPDKALVKKMMKAIAHRGPDQNGSYIDDKVSLGHQRLSIIDLSERGKQPMSNSDETVWIVFNGEIYNYKDLRRSLEDQGYRFKSDTDTEVLIHAYEAYGPKFVQRLNGDFAFCIYDILKKKFILARDRAGIKPLYYFFDGKHFMFASEYKSFLPFPFKREVNRKALSRYISLRYNYGRETLLDGVHRVLPGEMIVYDLQKKNLKHQRYWALTFDPRKITKASENYFVKQMRHLLQDSVRKQLMSDVPLGAYLSGGIDSASIVALMHKNGVKDIKTFSVGFGYGEETDELRHAKVISDHFNTDHHEFIVGPDLAKTLPDIVWHCDEPLADPALLPVYLLSKHTKPKATVVLTGDGGDEVFAGYEQNKFMRLGKMPLPLRRLGAPMLNALPTPILSKFFKYASKLGTEGRKRATEFLKKRLPSDQYLEIVSIFNEKERQALVPGLPSIRHEVAPYFSGNHKLLNKTLHFEIENLLPENMLHKEDRMTMAHAIEARVPFLDYRIMEFSETIPTNLKLKGNTEKYIVRKAMQPLLPKSILQRKKQRFYVPIDHWLAKDLRPMVNELLSPAELRTSGLNPEAVQRIKERYHRAPLFYARQLWTLLNYQIWHKKFIQGSQRI